MADRSGYIGRAPGDSSVTVARQTFSPTGITTDFTFASGYIPGYFDIFINGAKMIEGSDYTSTDGSTFVILNGGAISGDVIEGVAYKAFNAATATVGIYSGGDPISTQANILNFVGTGNTFALRGSTVDISISGGGAGAGGTWSNYDSNAGVTTTKKVKIQNNLEVTGVTTSTGGFVGALTGNVTGNIAGATGSFTGNVSVGGTLTYEDVTNVDSVGLVTARTGVRIVGGGLTVTGVSTFHNDISIPGNRDILMGGAADDTTGALKIYNNSNRFFEIYSTSKEAYIRNTGSDANGININANATVTLGGGGTGSFSIEASNDGTAKLYGPGPLLKLQTTSGGISITGTSTCTGGVQIGAGQSFGANGPTAVYYGDGSNLTNLPAAGLTTEALVSSGIVTTLNLTAAQDHKVTASGITTITVSGGTEADSHTVRIINSGITTVGFSTYFLFPSGSAPSLPTASGAISLISFTVNRVGAGGTQLLAGASLNFS